MDKNFTYFIILKDRPSYTFRLMNFLNFLNFPFNIILADGGKNNEIEKILSCKENFPNLTYEYLRYPYDETVNEFYLKMADAIEHINTPVASVVDNDDFHLVQGIYNSLLFLKENDHYSSARGSVTHITVSAGDSGQLNIGHDMYPEFKDSIVSDSASERVSQQATHFHANWHNPTRTNHLKAIWNMINVVKPQNMRFVDNMTGFLNVAWGNGYRGNYPWMLHQHAERIEIKGQSLKTHFPPQNEWVSSEFWLEEFNKMTEVVGVAIAEYDGISVEDAMEGFTEIYPYKVKAHVDLFKSRVEEAKKIGYDENRIQKLFDVVKKYDVKIVQPIGDLNSNFLSAQEEVDVLSKFLLES